MDTEFQATFHDLNIIKGDKGDTGEPGQNGYTPQKGIDYFTEDDKTDFLNKLSPLLNNKLDKFAENPDLQGLIVIANSDGTVSTSSYTFNDVKKFIPRVKNAVHENIPMFHNLNVTSTEDYGTIVDSGRSIHDFLTEHQDISGKEDMSNKVTSISSTSTDTEYPSAKCVYDLIGDLETLLGGI